MCQTGGPRCSAHIAADILREREKIEECVERARVAELRNQLGSKSAGSDLEKVKGAIEKREVKLRALEDVYDQTPQGMIDSMGGFPNGSLFQGPEVERRVGARISQVARGKATRAGQHTGVDGWEVVEPCGVNEVRYSDDGVTVTSPDGESVCMHGNGTLEVKTRSGSFTANYSLSRYPHDSDDSFTMITVDGSSIGNADRWDFISSLRALGYKTGAFKSAEVAGRADYAHRVNYQPTIISSSHESISSFSDSSHDVRRSLAFSLRKEENLDDGRLRPHATIAMKQMASNTISRAESLPQAGVAVMEDSNGDRFITFRPHSKSLMLMSDSSISYTLESGKKYLFSYDKQAVLRFNGENWETHPFRVSYGSDGFMRAQFSSSDPQLQETLSMTGLFR